MGDVKLVAFVFSPLQALNLVEYSERTARQVDVVVVGVFFGLEPSSRTQIESVLSRVSPRKIIYRRWIITPKQPIGARRAVLSAVAALRTNLSAGPYEFVVGEYRSAFSWAVLHRLKNLARAFVVVDDGTSMLRIDRRPWAALRSREQWRQRAKNLTFLAMGIRGVVPPRGLTFFTTYALENHVANGDTVVRNDYRILSGELRDLPPDDDYVYAIGGPHEEAMRGVLEAGEVEEADLELALELTRFAAEYTGKAVVYMAHRRERPEKLDALRKEVRVVTPDVPFEIYPLALGKRPRTIVSYYSSLLVTAAELFGDSVEIIALQIPRDRIDDSWAAFVEDVYRYFQTELGSAIRVVEQPSPSPT